MTLLACALGTFWVGAVVLTALDGRRRAVGWGAVAVLAGAVALLAVLAAKVWTEGEPVAFVAGGWPIDVGIGLRADALGVLFAVLSAGVLLIALVHEVLAGVRSRTFCALVLFMGTGLTGLFLTGDVFSFYVFFELAMMSAYALAAYGGERQGIAAALILAVVNLLGSFVFLISVAAVYRVTGTLEMGAVAERMAEVDPNTAMLIAVGFFLAFGIKLGLFPFHFWLPGVYAGTRPAVVAILAGALANIGSYGLLRFGADLLAREVQLASGALIAIGLVSVVYGSMQALSRRAVREVLAYSTIGQAGFVLIALGVGGPVGLAAAVLFAVVNSLNKALLFLSAELRGWMVGAAFALGAFSVAGVPPTAGFFGKAALFDAGLEQGSAVLVVLLVGGSLLSFVYMFQIYQHDFWRPETDQPAAVGFALRTPAFALALVVLAVGLWPEPLLAVTEEASGVLVREGLP